MVSHCAATQVESRKLHPCRGQSDGLKFKTKGTEIRKLKNLLYISLLLAAAALSAGRVVPAQSAAPSVSALEKPAVQSTALDSRDDRKSDAESRIATMADASQAVQLAIDEAGAPRADVLVSKCDLESENGKRVCEIELYAPDAKYEIEIDPASAMIVSSSQKPYAAQEAKTGISARQALKAACTQAKADLSQAKYVSSEVEIEDGMSQYELEWIVSRTRFEASVSAQDGRVLELEKEAVSSRF